MEYIAYKNGYEYYQCHRCAKTRKQKVGFLSSGPIEGSSVDEIKRVVAKKPNKKKSALGKAAKLGAAALFIGAIVSGSNDSGSND